MYKIKIKEKKYKSNYDKKLKWIWTDSLDI